MHLHMYTNTYICIFTHIRKHVFYTYIYRYEKVHMFSICVNKDLYMYINIYIYI